MNPTASPATTGISNRKDFLLQVRQLKVLNIKAPLVLHQLHQASVENVEKIEMKNLNSVPIVETNINENSRKYQNRFNESVG